MLTNKICARPFFNSNYFHISLSIPICRPWTSLGSTVFTQIVFSYNYERLIRSISTPFCLPNKYALFVLIFLRPFYLSPLFVLPLFFPSISTPFISTPLLVLIFLLLLLLLPLFLLPTTLPSICTHNMYAFFRKIFPKKISTPKSVPKNFPKIFTYYNYSSPLLFNRKVNSSYSFYKILNTKFWRLYETIKTNGKNYYGFGGTKNSLLSECVLSRLFVSFGVSITMEAEAYLARVCRFS